MKKSILTVTAMTTTLLSATAQGHYKEYGSTDKPAILIIHGFPGNATDWEATAKGLSDHYRVIVPDLIGFGNNANKNLPFDQVWLSAQTENLINVLQQAGVDTFSIIAHDFGVPVAITVATLYKTQPIYDTPEKIQNDIKLLLDSGKYPILTELN